MIYLFYEIKLKHLLLQNLHDFTILIIKTLKYSANNSMQCHEKMQYSPLMHSGKYKVIKALQCLLKTGHQKVFKLISWNVFWKYLFIHNTINLENLLKVSCNFGEKFFFSKHRSAFPMLVIKRLTYPGIILYLKWNSRFRKFYHQIATVVFGNTLSL